MDCYLILLAIGLVNSDKLDRTYLPPPGAILAGGNFDDLQTPLEFPKDTLSYTQPNAYDQSPLSFQSGVFQKAFPNNQDLNEEITVDVTPKNDLTEFKDTTNTQPDMTNDFQNNESVDVNLLPLPTYYTGTKAQSTQNTNIDGLNNFQNLVPQGFEPYNQNNGQLSTKPIYSPKIVTSYDVVENYQPNAFGYYGGKPMVMTSRTTAPQYFDNSPENKYLQKINQSQSNKAIKPVPEYPEPSLVDTKRINLIRTEYSNPFSPALTKSETDILLEENPLIYLKLSQESNLTTDKRIYTIHNHDKNAKVIKYENTITPEGFSFNFDTSNGIHADETGTAINGVKAKGSYSYIDNDGNNYTITYTADENGFQPIGNHLPSPPPIPEAIQKVIEDVNKNRVAGVFDDGSYNEEKYGYRKYQGAMETFSYLLNNSAKNNQRSRGNKLPNSRNRRPDNNRNIKLRQEDLTQLNNDSNNNKQSLKKYNRKGSIQQTYEENLNKNPISYKDNNQQKFSNNNEHYIMSLNAKQINNTNSSPNTEDIRFDQKNRLFDHQNVTTTVNMFSDSFPAQRFKQTDNRLTLEPYMFEDQNQNSENRTPYVYNQLKSNNLSKSPEKLKNLDDGYFYVPPLIIFDEKTSIIANSNHTFNEDTLQTSARANNENGLKNGQENNFVKAVFHNQYLPDINSFTTKSDIELEGQNMKNNDDANMRTILSPVRNDANEFTVSNFESNMYTTTTPLQNQPIQYNANNIADGFSNQFYQSRFDESLPSTTATSIVEPYTFNENINIRKGQVKVDGFGRPILSDYTPGYPDETGKYDNRIYTQTPEYGSAITNYNDRSFMEPVHNRNNDKVTDDFNQIGQYEPTNFVKPSQDPLELSTNSLINNFPGPNIFHGTMLTTPDYNSKESTVIGEDFTGPKQAQHFDPLTGYHY